MEEQHKELMKDPEYAVQGLAIQAGELISEQIKLQSMSIAQLADKVRYNAHLEGWGLKYLEYLKLQELAWIGHALGVEFELVIKANPFDKPESDR